MQSMKGELLKRGIDLRNARVQKMRRASSYMVDCESFRYSHGFATQHPRFEKNDDSSDLMSALVEGLSHF